MTRAVDAVVTGFTKNAALCEASFAPLRRLKQDGVIRTIHYVTWDSADIDGFVAPVETMDDVATTRVPQPAVTGSANQKSVLYQVANLDAALRLVEDGETLIVKSRPDFIYDCDFLRAKVEGFEGYSAIARGGEAFGTQLPDPPFARKIWLPWADAGQPFFYEDGAFIGLRRDVELLVTRNVEALFAPIASPGDCGSISHVVRYAPLFLAGFPIFQRYLDEYTVFVNDMDYRGELIAAVIEDPFFWHLVTAHAWILQSAFHIDCGRQGDLRFYPNTNNTQADWSDVHSLRLGNPYDKVETWRSSMQNGTSMLATVGRAYGRLLDDSWQHRMFSEGFADFPPDVVPRLVRNLALYSTGLLNDAEDMFYARLEHLHDKWLDAPVRIAG